MSKILVVDDDGGLVKLIERVLTSQNIEVTSLVSACLMSSIINKDKFDAIITDLKMPAVDGFSVVEEVRRSGLNKDTPIILMSGFLDKPSMERMTSLGIQAALVKPFSMKLLIDKISEVTHGK